MQTEEVRSQAADLQRPLITVVTIIVVIVIIFTRCLRLIIFLLPPFLPFRFDNHLTFV